jgi:hypothetical protein
VYEGVQRTWEAFKDEIVFQEDEFRRWANLKNHFTVFELSELLQMSPGSPAAILTPEIRKNKWTYYSYESFMRFINQYLQ